jgi:hypothetical protein
MRRLAMSIVAVAFFLLSAPWSPVASQDLPALFPMQQRGKWGFIDRSGKLVRPPTLVTAGGSPPGRVKLFHQSEPEKEMGRCKERLLG